MKMSRHLRPVMPLVIGIVLAVLAAALSSPIPENKNPGAAALYIQATPTPLNEDGSEIGSTDGIVLMGAIIVLLIVLPVLLQRKTWSSK